MSIDEHDLKSLAQHGVILTKTLRAAGITSHDTRRLHRSGQLVPVVRGAWTTPDLVEPFKSRGLGDLAMHRVRTTALILRIPGKVAAYGVSATVLHGLPLWRASLEHVHLTRTRDLQSRHSPSAILHERGLADLVSIEGLPSVGVADAIVQLGMTQNRPSQSLEMLIAGDAALHRGLCTPDELDEALDRHSGQRGMGRVRLLAPHFERLHESAAETRLGHCCRVIGRRSTPQVTLQIGDRIYRVDRLLDEHPVVIEIDGLSKYGSTESDVRSSLDREKSREDELREVGLGFVRVRWKQCDDPWALDQRIERAVRATTGRSLSPALTFLTDHPLAR